HLLASHPTPPSFDGPEDKNGRRNSDEIAFWASYIEGGPDSWHTDDAGTSGGIAGAPFVIVGDLNADPSDNDATDNAIVSLLAHPRVNDTQPKSLGGPEQAELQGQANDAHKGDPALDTSDFIDTVGNLRVDYALPSSDLDVQGSGVFWPASTDPLFPLVGVFPFPLSDHRAVWVDLKVP
ncbi:MAG: endonuclease/exonuclease/phosphatase family protein, partial [Myxococcota bacterium]